MYREVLLCLLLCRLSGNMHDKLVPHTKEIETHRLSKKQATCPGVYFLEEPPPTLQCNPDPVGTLTVNCNFLTGILITSQVPLQIGWFFSRDGRVGRLVQISQCEVRGSLTSLDSVLVVLNALPGAYFCSVVLTGTDTILDSIPLTVDTLTIQDVCLAQELPTLQPPQPRCAVRGIPLDPATPLVPRTRLAVTNTINLVGGVVATPTPTFTINIPPTMNIPIVEPDPTGTPAQQQGNNAVGIGVWVGIAVGVTVVVLVTVLPVSAICFIKKRERNQLTKNKKKFAFSFNQSQLNTRIQEPLIAPPPGRPPPIRPANSTPSTEDVPVELIYTDADISHNPQPYEVSRSPRYAEYPSPGAPVKAQSGELVHEDKQQGSNIYYSRPKFFKPAGRTFSTSTHAYGDLETENRNSVVSSSGMYISAQHLEPYHPTHNKKIDTVTEEELMLEDSYISTDFISKSEEEGEEGEEEEEEEEEEEGSTEYSEEEEEEDEEKSLSYNQNPSSWLDKSRQSKVLTESIQQPIYVNTRHSLVEEAEETVEYANAHLASVNAHKGSTKSAPSGSAKKKKSRKIRRNESTPLVSYQEEEEYTGLVKETVNYTSVYASTREGNNK